MKALKIFHRTKYLIQLKKFFTMVVIGMACISTCNAQESGTEVYHSDQLSVIQFSKDCYVHTSWLHSGSFGKVPCNGMLIVNNNEAIVIDTPVDTVSAKELIEWIRLQSITIEAVVVTHFHVDCIGSLNIFHREAVPSYSNTLTLALVDTLEFELPQNTFSDSLDIEIGNSKLQCRYMGAGHTLDNIVCYYPDAELLFGGCLIKSIGSGKGNLEDANISEWPETVSRILDVYPNIKIVIPGHGAPGDRKLLEYTQDLFSK